MPKRKKTKQVSSHVFKTDSGGILRSFVVGLVVTIILVGLVLHIESLPLGHRIEILAYEFLHGQKAPFSPEIEMPVIVIDISKIPGGRGSTVTSRVALKAILAELVNQKPLAIAVDIDFSPNDDGWIDNGDPEFFEYCLEQRRSANPVPIILGVYRTSSQKPAAWLGSAEFKELAADMSINSQDTSRVRLWVQKGEEEQLPSISAALVRAERIPLPQPPRWLKFALADHEHVETSPEDQLVHSADMLVNYSKLELIESQSIPTSSPQAIKELGQRIRNKFVIIGDGTIGQACDTFLVPGRLVPVPGVYLHASGVYTLTVEPFYELRSSFRLLLDFVLSLTILLVVSFLRWQKRNESFDWHRAQKRFVWWAVVAMIAIGILAVRMLDVLWLDFVLVLFALLLHPAIENRVVKLLHLHG